MNRKPFDELRQDMTGPRRPQRRGPVAGSLLTSDPTGRRLDHRSRSSAIVPSPQAPRRRVVLDRRSLGREGRREDHEDQQHRSHHREGRPERGRGDRSDRAIEADGCVHGQETPDGAILFRFRGRNLSVAILERMFYD